MQGAESFSSTNAAMTKVKIADREFSPRQVKLLEGVFGLFSDEFTRSLEKMLNELEQDLFRNAEQARSNDAQRSLLELQRRIHERRARLRPAFLEKMETALATLADPPPPKIETPVRPQFSELSLVDTGAMDEAVAVKEIATRSEIRNSLSLFLLGQRLGVVARRPAFDAEHLPFGPHRLCRILRETIADFELAAEHRGLVYRQFDRSVMQYLTPFYEALNNYLIDNGVLPHLTYIAPRTIAAKRRREAESSTAAPGAAPKPTAKSTPPGPSETPTGAGEAPDMRSIPARGGGSPYSPGQAASPGHVPANGSPPVRGSSRVSAPGAPGKVPLPGNPSAAGNLPARGTSPRRAMSNLEEMLRQATSDAASDAGMAEDANTASPRMSGSAPAPAPDMQESLPWSRVGNEQDEDGEEVELFDTLRRLLAGRRTLLDKLQGGGGVVFATPDQVQHSLDRVQQHHGGKLATGGTLTFAEIKRELLAQLRKASAGGAPLELSRDQGDTVDLVGMLFDQISREVRPQTPGGKLLSQLQLPLLRVALQDQDFFTDRAHPARRMLEVVAETSMYWSSEDENDRDLMQKMGALVQRANEEQSADPTLFRNLMTDLTGHLTTQQRKAEVTERRHVEAARGREKLEIARLKAEEAIEAALLGKIVPKFLHALLEQVWTDVLALSLLRGGEQSPAFKQNLALATRVIGASVQGGKKPAIDAAEAATMRVDIETALAQVGHAGEEAGDISTRLLSVAVAGEAAAEAAAAEPEESRTELTMKLRGRARLGQDVQGGRTAEARKAEKGAPLTPEEKIWHERLKRLPYGTWFDFTINQQGDRARRRMSWFSTVTDHCLFVNHRGQRAGDYTLTWLAREMNRGNVRLVEQERGSIVDRAWKAILSTLRSFAGNTAVPAAT